MKTELRDTPETDAAADWYLAAAYSTDPEDRTVPLAVSRKLERERDEARIQEDIHFQNFLQMRRERDEARAALADVEEYGTDEINAAFDLRRKLATALVEHDEEREKIKELIYIAERAIALAEIDFENDKFGVVTELRDALEQIKEGAK
jgi:hypothetical protein